METAPSNEGQGVRAPRLAVVSIFAVLAIVLSAQPGNCHTCDVPTETYPSIQSAIEVINCTEIVLAPGWYFGDVSIGRSLLLRGQSSETTTIAGQTVIQGDVTEASLVGLTVAGAAEDFPYDSLVIEGNADLITDDVVISSTDVIFMDGFERGNDTAW